MIPTMSTHALERLRNRAGVPDPVEAATEIIAAIDAQTINAVAAGVAGEFVFEILLKSGRLVFPVMAVDGGIKTVLSEGMEIQTPTGQKVLKRTPLAPGIYDFTSEQYHSDPCADPSLSSSIARLLVNKSALHAWTASPRLNPLWKPTNSKTFDIGRAAHRAVLGRGGDYVAIPENLLSANGAISTKAAKDYVEECRKRGLTPIKQEEKENVEEMARVCHAALADLGIVLTPERSEVAAIGEIDGVWCRMMADNAPAAPVRFNGKTRRVLIDFKTTEDASPERSNKAVENYGYDIQWAHYLDTWEAATGERRDWLFVTQEKVPPFEVSVVHLFAEPDHSGDWSQDAMEKVAYARSMWRHHLETDNWPGYPRVIVEPQATPYFRQRWQDKVERAGVVNKAGRAAIDAARKWQAPESSE